MSERNRQWVLKRRPVGAVQPDDFELVDAPPPEPADGELLVRNLWLSFDPTQRGWLEDRPSYLPPVQIGEVLRASTVGQVVRSRHPDFRAGDLVFGLGGWQERFACPAVGFPGVRKVLAWVRAGEIVHEEDVQHGFENIPATLNRLFTGQNLGKQLLQLGEPEPA